MDTWPSYLSFIVSFFVIGIMWMNHHEMFRDIDRTDHLLVVSNLMLLLTICFLPFPTAVLADAMRESEGVVTATVFLGACFTANAVFFNLLWLRARLGRRLIDAHVSDARLERRTRRYVIGPLAYGITMPLALITPVISVGLFVAYAVLYLLPAGE